MRFLCYFQILLQSQDHPMSHGLFSSKDFQICLKEANVSVVNSKLSSLQCIAGGGHPPKTTLQKAKGFVSEGHTTFDSLLSNANATVENLFLASNWQSLHLMLQGQIKTFWFRRKDVEVPSWSTLRHAILLTMLPFMPQSDRTAAVLLPDF